MSTLLFTFDLQKHVVIKLYHFCLVVRISVSLRSWNYLILIWNVGFYDTIAGVLVSIKKKKTIVVRLVALLYPPPPPSPQVNGTEVSSLVLLILWLRFVSPGSLSQWSEKKLPCWGSCCDSVALRVRLLLVLLRYRTLQLTCRTHTHTHIVNQLPSQSLTTFKYVSSLQSELKLSTSRTH